MKVPSKKYSIQTYIANGSKYNRMLEILIMKIEIICSPCESISFFYTF